MMIRSSTKIALAGCCLLALASAAQAADKKKVLMIDSYHEGYAWSDAEVGGAKSALKDSVDLKVLHMDVKRNPSPEFKKQAAEKVKAEIDAFKPDAVIACDDVSVATVLVPFYKDSTTPWVFCGVNWDASMYNLPPSHVTGMLEVSLVPQLMDNLQKYAKGKKVAFLGADNDVDKKEALFITKKYGVEVTTHFVKTFEELKAAYVDIQGKFDILFWVNNAGIKDWNIDEAKKFVAENTKIPSGSCHDFMAPLVLITYAKLGEEQGEWAGNTVLQILGGKAVKDIPVASNQKGQLYVNMPLAKKLGIQLPLEVLKSAKVVKD
jgi:ABC-type uncharacterized transport system substrate-binding protein